MDEQLGVQQHHGGVSKPPVHKAKGVRSSRKHGVKVVYIASPVKLTVSADEFRALVQELTGRRSSVAAGVRGRAHGASQLMARSSPSSTGCTAAMPLMAGSTSAGVATLETYAAGASEPPARPFQLYEHDVLQCDMQGYYW